MSTTADGASPQVYEQNERESRRALAVFDRHLGGREWLVGERMARLSDRPNCPYRKTR